jgi:hypothetical protein
MPHVIDDPDVLEHSTTTPDCDETQALPRVLPSARRGHPRLFAVLRGLFTTLRRRRTPREQPAIPRTQPFELPMDILAREHPDLYLRSMSGIG